MAKTYSWRFYPRTYEIDTFGHVNNAIYANYLEEGATQASSAAGYDWDWYMRNRHIWVVRQQTIRYDHPAVYGEELEITTWVSDFSRVRSHREYVLKQVKTGTSILRARTAWVYVDMDTLAPKRIPEEFYTAFDPTNEPLEDLGVRIRGAEPCPGSHEFTWMREVESGEIDAAGHVNNAIYLRWIENAYVRALESVNWGLQRQREVYQLGILVAGHILEYFKPARLGDRVKVVSRVVEVGRVRGAWNHEIRHAETDELLVRDYAVGVFLDFSSGQPRPIRLPEPILQSALTGIPS
jgi:acyl-CoA thioester hydrolase